MNETLKGVSLVYSRAIWVLFFANLNPIRVSSGSRTPERTFQPPVASRPIHVNNYTLQENAQPFLLKCYSKDKQEHRTAEILHCSPGLQSFKRMVLIENAGTGDNPVLFKILWLKWQVFGRSNNKLSMTTQLN